MNMEKISIEKNVLRSLYGEQKLSMAEIGKKFHCSPNTIQRIMRRYKIKPRTLSEAAQKFLIPKRILKKLYCQKRLSTAQIGEQYHCSHATVLNKMKIYGLKRRSKLGTRKAVIIPKEVLKKLYVDKKLSQSQVAMKMKCSKCAIEKLIKKYNIKSRSLSEAQMKYPKYDFSGDLTEKAYLIGFRLGDLNVVPARLQIQVRCSTTVSAQVLLIKSLFSKYTHLKITQSRFIKNQLVTDIRCLLNKSFEFLLPKQDKIESWILTNKRFFLSFVAGYVDAEGCFLIRKYKDSKTLVAGFELQSCDKNIIRNIWKNVSLLGIQSPEPKISRLKGYRSKNGAINRGNMWRLSIYRKDSLMKFLNLIEPYLKHSDKRKKVHYLKENIISRSKRIR